ncbi:MAG: DUF3343 domain-containing protein [Clostridia bacterium]|nr:DUF3343 domain-containing protein [Clostridia bacterium]
MEQIIVVFSSITSATGVKNHLSKKYKIQSKLRQTPKNLAIAGCSYCLVVAEKDLDTVKKVARDNGLTLKGIFRNDGTRI